MKPGDKLEFGTYPQTERGEDCCIDWIVLKVYEASGIALLISKDGLDAVPYNEENKDVPWGDCSLRRWLNNEFLNRAFDQKHQKVMLSIPAGFVWGDKVSLLDDNEAMTYCGTNGVLGPEGFTRIVIPTEYAALHGADASTPSWWIRPSSFVDFRPSVVSYGGIYCQNPCSKYCCVRPVIRIDIQLFEKEFLNKDNDDTDLQGDVFDNESDEPAEFDSFDPVTKPFWYTNTKIDTIDYLRDKLTSEEFTGFCGGNVLKYVSRWRRKNGIEDLCKAAVYLDWMIESAKQEETGQTNLEAVT